VLKPKSSQSSGCTHFHQTSWKKVLKNAVGHKADGNCFLGQERNVDGGIHATRDHNVTNILQNNKKNCIGSFRTNGMEC
jgi:hypothetical protein